MIKKFDFVLGKKANNHRYFQIIQQDKSILRHIPDEGDYFEWQSPNRWRICIHRWHGPRINEYNGKIYLFGSEYINTYEKFHIPVRHFDEVVFCLNKFKTFINLNSFYIPSKYFVM